MESMIRFPAPEIERAAEALGLSEMDLMRVETADDFGESLRELKARIRRNYEQLVHDLHPDKVGNDPKKREFLQHVVQTWRWLSKLQPPHAEGETTAWGGWRSWPTGC